MTRTRLLAIFFIVALLGGCATSNDPNAPRRSMPTTFHDAGPNYPDTGH